MDEHIAIRVKGLSKRYTIGAQKSDSLRHSLGDLFRKKKTLKKEFWALRDVNFEIQKGDVVGIVGKNGAGKSTLLKILSQITKPTDGSIEINGRIASLLEVGTGFHHELTGRENIYLNGTILGMTRKEVAAKFDEIVEFSGVEKFIDTPVKHYSSGMYVRLAFAVAAHLEPEILIIDEVLAVGDAEFQKKCLGKMEDVAKQGRTVLFVSHDTEALSLLCQKGILLNQGEVIASSKIEDVLRLYHDSYQEAYAKFTLENRPTDGHVALNSLRLINRAGEEIYATEIGEDVGIEVNYSILTSYFKPCPNVHIYTTTGVYTFVHIFDNVNYEPGDYVGVCWIPKNLLNNISYTIGVAFTTMKQQHIHFYEKELIKLDIIESKSMRKHEWGGDINGVVRPLLENKIIRIE